MKNLVQYKFNAILQNPMKYFQKEQRDERKSEINVEIVTKKCQRKQTFRSSEPTALIQMFNFNCTQRTEKQADGDVSRDDRQQHELVQCEQPARRRPNTVDSRGVKRLPGDIHGQGVEHGYQRSCGRPTEQRRHFHGALVTHKV